MIRDCVSYPALFAARLTPVGIMVEGWGQSASFRLRAQVLKCQRGHRWQGSITTAADGRACWHRQRPRARRDGAHKAGARRLRAAWRSASGPSGLREWSGRCGDGRCGGSGAATAGVEGAVRRRPVWRERCGDGRCGGGGAATAGVEGAVRRRQAWTGRCGDGRRRAAKCDAELRGAEGFDRGSFLALYRIAAGSNRRPSRKIDLSGSPG